MLSKSKPSLRATSITVSETKSPKNKDSNVDYDDKGDDDATNSSCSKNKIFAALSLTGQCCPASSSDDSSSCNDETNANADRLEHQHQRQQHQKD